MYEGSGATYQFQNFSTCQRCARTIVRGTDSDWLDDTWTLDSSYRIVRCPIHWSAKALRQTVGGRTRYRMEKMERLKIKYAHWIDMPYAPILPMIDERPDGFPPCATT